MGPSKKDEAEGPRQCLEKSQDHLRWNPKARVGAESKCLARKLTMPATEADQSVLLALR